MLRLWKIMSSDKGARLNKHSIETGIGFGTTSGIITTLGLIVGLHSGTGSRAVIIGGVFTIAIADAFSDALGIHVSEETEKVHNEREIWLATIMTFLAKFIVAMTFLVPIMTCSLSVAMIISIAWGFSLLAAFSYYASIGQELSPLRVIGEHVFIAIIVIVLTHYIGEAIGGLFG